MAENNIQDYRDLSVWQFGMEITVGIYQLISRFPNDEKYGLTSQLRPFLPTSPKVMLAHRQRNSCSFSQFRSAR